MAEVLDWRSCADQPALVRRAVQALTEGQLVVFPTETVYGIAASALIPEAVERLAHSKGRPEDKPMVLALARASDAFDWVPEMSTLGRRLARRCWPGAVTLVFAGGSEHGAARQLTDGVRQRVSSQGNLGFRVPAHEAILQTLAQLPGPLVLTSANRSGAAPATSAQEAAEALGESVALIIDDGPSHFGQPSTVVQVGGNTWKVLREGVVSEADLKRLTARVIVFVCSGNTCRSPMAEAICKKLLAEQLHCVPEELPEYGFIVLSAGLAAMMGDRAAPEAVEAARELGADLSSHASKPLTLGLLAKADDVIAATRGHLLALAARAAEVGIRPRMLSPDGLDLPDPIGCDQEVYRECARQIERNLRVLLPEFLQEDSTSAGPP